MDRRAFSGFLYQFLSLVVAVIVVHAVYVTVVLPRAEAILAEQAARQAAGEEFEASRSIVIVVKDLEQEACFVLALWAIAIIAQKAREALRERRLLERALLEIDPGTSVLPEDVREYARPLETLPPGERECLLPRVLLAALQRFGSTRNVQDASTAVKEVCETESDRLDSELAMLRYIIWAIPSIGFIGTVRGIGQALGQAQRAVQGDILGVTESLGTAFNSTFIALIISIFVMFLTHQLQLLQERLVLDAHSYADTRLLRHFKVS